MEPDAVVVTIDERRDVVAEVIEGNSNWPVRSSCKLSLLGRGFPSLTLLPLAAWQGSMGLFSPDGQKTSDVNNGESCAPGNYLRS